MPTELLPWHVGGGNLTESPRETLSHTRLATFLQCPQKYGYSYLQNLELVSRPEPLTLGKAYQYAIEHNDPAAGAHLLRQEARVLSQADEDRLRVHETIVASAATLYLQLFQTPAPYIQAKREFGYRVRLRNPDTGYMSRSYDLLGYADEWVDYGNHAALIENKLVGQITETQVRKLPLDRQIALAAYGCWRATGLEVREVFYRWVRKPSIRQRQNESVEQYCERLAEDYATRPDFYAHEEHFVRTADDLLRIEHELWTWASQLREAGRMTFLPRNTSMCAEYGGCAFIPLCLGEQAEALYQQKIPHFAERNPLPALDNHDPVAA